MVREVYYSGDPNRDKNVQIVVFMDNIHGAVNVLNTEGTSPDKVDIEVDKWVKNISVGLGSGYQYRFVKKVDNVYFYR